MGPAGDIVLEDLKYGGTLLEGSRPGDRILRTFERPFGTTSGEICWDADFPTTVRQAGRNGTDILSVPSGDRRAVDPLHTQTTLSSVTCSAGWQWLGLWAFSSGP